MYHFDTSEGPGVVVLACAAIISLLSICIFFLYKRLRLQNFGNAYINGYFMTLLAANFIQAFGTVMNFRWAQLGRTEDGFYCMAQGGIKNAGNVATALWSFGLAMHLFTLLFLRIRACAFSFWGSLLAGWGLVLFIVCIGPIAIEKPGSPYFGVSGAWCWITDDYPLEQIYLEYFLEYLSAALCMILYTAIILRMRGNLLREEGRWCIRSLPSDEESWQLSLRRDLVDYTMLEAIQRMVWYPLAYTVMLIPITITRLTSFAGGNVPFWAIVIADVVFNLTGFVNVMIFLAMRRFFPDPRTLPELAMARPDVRKSLFKAGGISPFTLERSDDAEKFDVERLARSQTPDVMISLPALAKE
ncbi:unnamed protein product [Mycena citricolor]|uniref:Glucose receptor Git3 N-terminal domain-containing protein n=1 Tax=Mycena citricolor TaxID=2018698 RepID=A0AAD2HCR0_9AGAR|nr:unnamed protein product [Mycena citricolor]